MLSLNEAGIAHETVEDGTTFYENSLKKAREISEISGEYVVADDSGLCVDFLGGMPGIYSARFCGEHGNDKGNNDLLLEKLKDTENRAAHYACCVVLVSPNGKVYSAEDYMYGAIAKECSGTNGFGYDPLFIPNGYNVTLACIPENEKNAISHRGKAFRKLVEIIKNESEFTDKNM